MKYKQEIFIFILLVFLIFSISVVSANQSLDDTSNDELVLLSKNNELVDTMDVSVDTVQDDDSADLENNAETDESENGQNQKNNVLGASNNRETPLRAVNEIHMSGSTYVTQNGYTFKAIQEAINALSPGGKLFLDGKTFNQTGTTHIIINKDINIYGGFTESDVILATLDAKGKSRVIFSHGYYIQHFFNLNIINGKTNELVDLPNGGFTSYAQSETLIGAGLLLRIRAVQLENIIINNCTTNTHSHGVGAGIMVLSNYLISNCNFTNNLNTYDGGGVGLRTNGPGTINNCNFINNTIYGSAFDNYAGAGLQVWNPSSEKSIIINNCYFKNNSAYNTYSSEYHGHGGALCMLSSNCVCSNSTFINNKANEGGATTLHYDGTLFNCTFINNTATTLYGGAISTGYATDNIHVTVKSCDFEGNHAPIGGAVQLKGNDVQIIVSNFTNNSAVEGGACYIQGARAIIENSNFTGNNATYNLSSEIIISSTYKTTGAAVYIQGNNAKISNNIFELNNAIPELDKDNHPVNSDDGLGGAVYVKGDNTVTTNNTFNHNTARNGSAIYTDGNNFQLTNDAFYQNQAYSYLLITTAVPEESYFNEADINVTVIHVGGDNIINAIYNKAANNQIHFTNVHYTDSRHGKITTGTGVVPVNGAENSNGGELLYQDSREDYQNITLIITRQEDGEEVFNDTVITDIYGNATTILPAGLKKGKYTVYAEHPEDWNYKKIYNTAEFRINYSLKDNKTVSNETPYYGTEVDFNLTIHNDANVVYNDNGYEISMIYEHMGGEYLCLMMIYV